MPGLVLGPLLRRVTATKATIWVETDGPCEVTVVTDGPGRGVSRTFGAYGHHYALVVVSALAGPATYRVLLDGEPVWPQPDSTFPPSMIHPPGPGGPVRLVFGSCREGSPRTTSAKYPPDALDAYAAELAAGTTPRPDLLLLLGDQVYADKISPAVRAFLDRRRPDRPSPDVLDFSEYARLYLESWTDPEVRWLFSTVPSVMIFDDHEIVDDWNTSAAWLDRVRAHDWWAERITGGLASYWVYQHLGNLDPDELPHDPVAKQMRDDATGALATFAATEARASTYRWSTRLDIGRTRVIVLDTRAGRVLDPDRRNILSEDTWTWFTESLRGDYDHLAVGSSLPWLLPPAIHEVEAWDARLAASPRPRTARLGERLRQLCDMEHWAAWDVSFRRLGALLDAARVRASVCVLSGDVHHTYVARTDSGVYQLTSSPIHNQAPRTMKLGFVFGWSRAARAVGAALARAARVAAPPVRWRKLAGPFFSNTLGVLVHDGRTARVTIVGTRHGQGLRPLADLDLQ